MFVDTNINPALSLRQEQKMVVYFILIPKCSDKPWCAFYLVFDFFCTVQVDTRI